MSFWSSLRERLSGDRSERMVGAETTVVVYSRENCCLCDEAIALLESHGLEPQVVDIDHSPELREKFTSCVPVVEINGKIRFRGRVEPRLLRRLLSRI